MIAELHTTTQLTTAEQLLFDLVNIPSPSHEEHKAVAHLVRWMHVNGYDNAFIDEAGNAVGIIGQGEREIVLLGHIDTFGGTLSVYVDDDVLYGRGSVDAKGALCTFTVAAAQAELADDVRLIVIGAVEEEASTSKGARYASTQSRPEMCIIGEPSQWDRITLGYKGRLILEWRWKGALAHSASATISPAEHAVNYWQSIQTHVTSTNTNRNTMFSRLDATLQEINSGQDGAFGWAEAVIGFRLPPDIDPHELAECFPAENDATVTVYGHEQAHIADKDSVLSRALRKAIRNHNGRPRFVHKTGTADMNVVAPIWNCPMVAYGPGDSSLDHTPEEHLNLDEYNHAITVLTHALSTL